MKRIVFFQHPDFVRSESMKRFGEMLRSTFTARGYSTEVWKPQARVHARFAGTRLAKWAGYIDQYLIFPFEVRRRMTSEDADTMYVFCDQALGPWVGNVARRPHVVHCHDLLALKSALGLIPENPTRFTGRLYQRYIRSGFRKASHFVSISEKTRSDLHEFGHVSADLSEVVHNGVNPAYRSMPVDEARAILDRAKVPGMDHRFLLHVGGAHWYKNHPGTVLLYADYVKRSIAPLPLVMVTDSRPSGAVLEALARVPSHGRVHFVRGLSDEAVCAAYNLAAAFLFPSLAEGFGWPIAEAMMCRCLVITTGEAPMNEVGGPAAFYLDRLQAGDEAAWAARGASVLEEVLSLPDADRERISREGQAHARRFDASRAIDGYERIYSRVLASHAPQEAAL